MKEKLEQIKENSLRKINESKTINELQEVMKELTSKKSELTEIMKTLGSLSPEERKDSSGNCGCNDAKNGWMAGMP